MTCSDGMAQPPRPVRDLHPERPRPMGDRSQHGPDHLHQGSDDHQTIRCRKRRSTTSASTSPHTSPSRAHHELRAASPRQMPTSPGAWSPPSQLTAASSATVTVDGHPAQPTREHHDRQRDQHQRGDQPQPRWSARDAAAVAAVRLAADDVPAEPFRAGSAEQLPAPTGPRAPSSPSHLQTTSATTASRMARARSAQPSTTEVRCGPSP